MSEHANQEQELFEAARRLIDPLQRALFIEAASIGNPGLRAKIDELLAFQDEADQLFRPLPDPHAHLRNPSFTNHFTSEEVGAVIGRYKLLQKIGEGGMGVVYLAEQREPVRRRVALKIIKLGMDTKSVVARFEAERQALALMDHPNIARVLDGGATDTGRPFFVMELLQGVPITEFCDKNQLPTDDRIRLFTQVCHAVQSAHQKGIIHRDLKPSNVLVTLHDGVPVPKVIDFGVAKATNQQLTEKTLFTQHATLIGTPTYMSPEQAEMSGLDVDTRSDIYSLGVLLYELLTGTTPFSEQRLRSAGYGGMQRIIAAEEPERPSTRLSTMEGATRSIVAKNRSTEESALLKTVAGDLDWIVVKCLEKDRARRYETANALTLDVQRHLNHEPIFARPASVAYRFGKTIHRNKTAFAAGALIAATLAAATIVSTWQAIEAKRERQNAQEQAQIARATKDFIIEQMLAFNPFWNSDAAISAEKRASVDRLARTVEVSFAAQPLTRAEIHLALAAGYAALGDRNKWAAQATKALEIRERLLPPWHSDTLAAAAELVEACSRLGQIEQGKRLVDQWLGAARRSPSPGSYGEAWLLYQKGALLRMKGNLSEALIDTEKSVSILNRVLGRDHIRTRNVVWNLAAITQEAGRFVEAEQLWAEGTRASERDFGPEHFMTIQYKKGLAWCYLAKNEAQKARPLLEEIIPVYHRLVGTNHNNALDAEGLLGEAYEQQGHVSEAATLYATLYPRWAMRLSYPTAQNKCRGMEKFFQQHGYFEHSKAIHALLGESSGSNSSKETTSSASEHPPP